MLRADDGGQVVDVGIHFFTSLVKFLDFFVVDQGEVVDEMHGGIHTFCEIFREMEGRCFL